MLNHDFWRDSYVMSGLLTHGAKKNATKLRLEGTFLIAHASIEIKKLAWRISLLEMSRIIPFPGGILLERGSPKYGGHPPAFGSRSGIDLNRHDNPRTLRPLRGRPRHLRSRDRWGER